jgi:uncharacterized protein YwqG
VIDPQALLKKKLPARAKAILAHARPAVRLQSTRKKPKPRSSKIGGAPDLPDGLRWPQSGKLPLAFI